MAKRIWVIGNWKMYKTARQATDFAEQLLPLLEETEVQVCLAVPYTSIAPLAQFVKGTPLLVGAQNMHDASEGAFTGEIAAIMLKEAGASFVLLGHSERRQIFRETDAMVEKKVLRALQDGLKPVLCVGETLEEREAGREEEVLRRQLEAALSGVPKEAAGQILVAYEPVWAIGTGKAATPRQAEKAHAVCRSILEEIFGKRKAAAIPLLYGGSVKPENAAELLAEKEIDGVLVGGASLDPETLAKIVLYSQEKKPALKRKTKKKE